MVKCYMTLKMIHYKQVDYISKQRSTNVLNPELQKFIQYGTIPLVNTIFYLQILGYQNRKKN